MFQLKSSKFEDARPFAPDLYDNHERNDPFVVWLTVLTDEEHKQLQRKGLMLNAKAGRKAAQRVTAELALQEETIRFVFERKIARVENLQTPDGRQITTGTDLLSALHDLLTPIDRDNVIGQIVEAVTVPNEAEVGFTVGLASQAG